MRKTIIAVILASSITAGATACLVASHYMKVTAPEFHAQVYEQNMSLNMVSIEEMRSLSMADQERCERLSQLLASFESLQRAHDEIVVRHIYASMADHDPMRFQMRHVQCWISRDDSARCKAISEIASA